MTTPQGVTRLAGPPDAPPEHAELIARFCGGDHSALAPLVRIWEQRLLTIAFRVVGNLHDAEEVRQTVLVRLAQSRPNENRPDATRFAGWLRRCVMNEAIDHVRRRKNERHRTKLFDDSVVSPSPSPVQQAIDIEQAEQLQQAIGQLDPDCRALISLRFDEGLTIRQIAEVVEKPPMTVHSQIARAIVRLRRLLASDHPEGTRR